MGLFHRLIRSEEDSPSPGAAEAEIRISRSGAEPIVSVTGNITVDASPRLRSVLLGLIPNCQRVVVDISAVTRLDTSGLAVLLEVVNIARDHSVQLRLTGVSGQPRRLAELTVRRKMGVAFQEAALFGSLSVEDNVALPLQELTKLPASTIKLIVWMKLWPLGLADAAKLYPNELSGGMAKRVAVARAIALDPEIVVFDEPSAGLDPIVAAGLDNLILFLKETLGMTVLVVAHVLESAFRIADRLAMLHQGRLLAVEAKQRFQINTHPRIRQFLDRNPDPIIRGEQGFLASYLRVLQHEH